MCISHLRWQTCRVVECLFANHLWINFARPCCQKYVLYSYNPLHTAAMHIPSILIKHCQSNDRRRRRQKKKGAYFFVFMPKINANPIASQSGQRWQTICAVDQNNYGVEKRKWWFSLSRRLSYTFTLSGLSNSFPLCSQILGGNDCQFDYHHNRWPRRSHHFHPGVKQEYWRLGTVALWHLVNREQRVTLQYEIFVFPSLNKKEGKLSQQVRTKGRKEACSSVRFLVRNHWWIEVYEWVSHVLLFRIWRSLFAIVNIEPSSIFTRIHSQDNNSVRTGKTAKAYSSSP